MGFELTAEQILQGGVIIILGISYLGGFLTALTPCVYPLIPVTLGLLGVGKPKKRGEIVLFGLLFVLGLATVYSALGFLAATSGHFLGGLTQSKGVALWVAIIFVVMGFGMLGFCQISLPSSLLQWLARRDPTGYKGAFLLGATSGVLAAPCSGPVVVGILAYVGQQANPLFGTLLLFTFSLGLGTPFFLLTIFSRYLTRLPKGGAWTEGVKHIAGFAMLAAAILFIRPFVSNMMFTLSWVALLVYIVIFAGRYFPKKGLQVVRLVALSLVAVVFVVQRNFVSSLFVPEKSDIEWIGSESEGLELARKSGKLMIIDFWASWCPSCRQLDRETFVDPRVEEVIIRDFVAVKVDATSFSSTEVQRLVRKYEVPGLPTIIFTDSKGRFLKEVSINGFVNADELLKKVNELQTRHSAPD